MVGPRHTDASKRLDVEALLAGDRRAFEALVRQETPRLFRMIVRFVRDEDEAKSVLQETFLQAYHGLGTFRGDARFTTWLYAIGINLARGAARKQRRTTALEARDLERLQPGFVNGRYRRQVEAWNPQKLAERREREALVHDAIDRLPDAYRTIVILRDLQELSTAEAARILNVTEGAARVRLHRARQALRALLAEHFS